MEKKVVLITGATSGIGEATAHIFAQNQYDLVLTGRRSERLEALKNELTMNDINIYPLCFDIRQEKATEEAIHSLPENVLERLAILVNNAGLAVGKEAIQNGFLDDWERMIDTNVKGLLYMTKCVLPYFIEKQDGHIINIASTAGKEVYPGGNVYCATKHAVDALSKAMRIDLNKENIQVTNIAPGAVETEFSLVRFKGDEAKAKSAYDGYQPLTGQDVAEVIYFAASRPAHVSINDIVLTPKAQASATIFNKK